MKLVLDNLALARGERVLVAGLSCVVEAGSALVVTGPNGTGKTTLLRAIAGLLKPRAGSVRLDGGEMETVSEQCHYFGHLNAVKSSLSVEENARFWNRYLGGPAAAVDAALGAFALDALRDIPAGYLSAGQKRRLGLARLLLAERPLWLLDEPATSLDQASQDVLTQVINRFLARGGIVLAATHSALSLSPSRELRLGATSTVSAA